MTAFDFIRQFKDVSSVTEEIVKKTVKNKYGYIKDELILTIFEKGITGEYGKLYSADPQTLIGWINEYFKTNKQGKSYYETPLLDSTISMNDKGYPDKAEMWCIEVNKAFNAYLKGTEHKYFHPHLYDRLIIDNRIEINSYKKYMDNTNSIRISKQMVLNDYFGYAKGQGKTKIYESI